MSNKYIIGSYIKEDGIVHKLNPVFKILSLIIMVIAIFFTDSYIDILMLFAYLLLAIVYSNIKIKIYLKSILNIKVFLIFIFIIDLIFFEGLEKLFVDIFIVIFIILYSSILTFTTPTTEITYGIEKLLKPLDGFLPISDIAMVVTLTLRFIPTLTNESNRIIKAETLRGVNFKTKNIKEKINAISGILVPMFALSLNKAEEYANIMDIRLYNYGKSRSNYRLNRWKKIDSLLLILNILILIIVIIY